MGAGLKDPSERLFARFIGEAIANLPGLDYPADFASLEIPLAEVANRPAWHTYYGLASGAAANPPFAAALEALFTRVRDHLVAHPEQSGEFDALVFGGLPLARSSRLYAYAIAARAGLRPLPDAIDAHWRTHFFVEPDQVEPAVALIQFEMDAGWLPSAEAAERLTGEAQATLHFEHMPPQLAAILTQAMMRFTRIGSERSAQPLTAGL